METSIISGNEWSFGLIALLLVALLVLRWQGNKRNQQ